MKEKVEMLKIREITDSDHYLVTCCIKIRTQRGEKRENEAEK